MNRSHLLGAVCMPAIIVFSSATIADSFTPLGDLPGGEFWSNATGVSDDGSVVVGHSTSALGSEAFRWTSNGGMVGLGDLPGGDFSGLALGVSGDGSVIVGFSTTAASYAEAFRWTSGEGMVGLGGSSNAARGVSSDGSVIVGGRSSALGQEAFRWTNSGGMVGLGDIAGGNFGGTAYAASGNGSVIVGQGSSALGAEAFRWTRSGGQVGLGDIAGGSFGSVAYGVSDDGSVIVGYGKSDLGQEAFRWTSSGGMVGLGDLAGGSFSSAALSVSGDGSVIVGQGNSALGMEAFRWTSSGGIQSVASILTEAGIDLTGWTLTRASGISADGYTIVGYGTNPDGFREAWMAYILAVHASVNIEISDGTPQECTDVSSTIVSMNAQITLDDTDALDTVTWTMDGSPVASGEFVDILVPLGAHSIEATVTTMLGQTATDTTTIVVEDTTAPTITTTFIDSKTGAEITSIKGKDKATPSYGISDVCDPAPTVVSATVGVPAEGVNTVSAKISRKDSSVNVSINGNTDTAELTVTAEDASGNTSSSKAVLTIIQ